MKRTHPELNIRYAALCAISNGLWRDLICTANKVRVKYVWDRISRRHIVHLKYPPAYAGSYISYTVDVKLVRCGRELCRSVVLIPLVRGHAVLNL